MMAGSWGEFGGGPLYWPGPIIREYGRARGGLLFWYGVWYGLPLPWDPNQVLTKVVQPVVGGQIKGYQYMFVVSW